MTDKHKSRCKFYGCLIPQDVPHRHPFGKPVVIERAKPWFVLVQKKAAPVKRLSFSRLILKFENWVLLLAGAISLGSYLILEAVTALGWAS